MKQNFIRFCWEKFIFIQNLSKFNIIFDFYKIKTNMKMKNQSKPHLRI
ncbi:MAG: hypothetical protein RL757_2400 [Bacteroidota bacterium]|jgi:hypothetical protein